MEGSKFIERPGIWHEQKLEAQERIMALQLGQVDRRLERIEALIEGLLGLGPRSVVVTLGADGALLATGGTSRRFGAPEVEAVDTTGAGDAFVGALAAGLAAGSSLEEAVPYAVGAGAVAVTREGAQGSLPTSKELERFSSSSS